jgi:hypothetical protein
MCNLSARRILELRQTIGNHEIKNYIQLCATYRQFTKPNYWTCAKFVPPDCTGNGECFKTLDDERAYAINYFAWIFFGKDYMWQKQTFRFG